MSIINQLKTFNLDDEQIVTLHYTDDIGVYLHNDTAIDTMVDETSVVEKLFELLATPSLEISDVHGDNVLEYLKEVYGLDEYNEKSVLIDRLQDLMREDFYDQELIAYSIEQLDHKRGIGTVEVSILVTLGELIRARPDLNGWKASFSAGPGIMMLSE
jgi:hypothetical protein